MMKNSMISCCPVFNTNRMVAEYTEKCYLPAAQTQAALSLNNLEPARKLAAWKNNVFARWNDLRIEPLLHNKPENVKVGEVYKVHAKVNLGRLTPDDVLVQVYHGLLDAEGVIRQGRATDMKYAETNADGSFVYEGTLECKQSGRQGYTLRALPRHPDLSHQFEMYLIKWA
jgi:starch phosphorylase